MKGLIKGLSKSQPFPIIYPQPGIGIRTTPQEVLDLIYLFAVTNDLILDENGIILADEEGNLLSGV